MGQCEAVRKRGSSDRCPHKSLGLLTLCGLHVKSLNIVRWKDIHKKSIETLVVFQAICRGWLVRRFFAFAGPGVLRRSGTTYANTEEIVSGDEVATADPMTYFAFVENEKVFWFSIDSLWKWTCQSVYPSNPYTKVPISNTIMLRLRENRSFRLRQRMFPLPGFGNDYETRLRARWTSFTHLFRAHGFDEIHPSLLIDLTKTQHRLIHTHLSADMDLYYEKNHLYTKLKRPIELYRIYHARHTSQSYIMQSTQVLYGVCMLVKDPYILLFSIASAIRRC